MASVASLSSTSSLLSRTPSGIGSGHRSVAPLKLKTHQSRRRIVAAAAGEDAGEKKIQSLDRRELLAGTVAGGMSLIDPVHAKPVGNPNMRTCHSANVEKGQMFQSCCPPKQRRATIDFKPDDGPMRIRPAAHLVDEDYIAKYNKAYKLMRALPDGDPRSLKEQANVHCAYCNYGYNQMGDDRSQLQIHFSWLFLPWHRWYLYFHEKILGSLINDPTFALPFWNWDNQEGGNLIPEMFLREGTALYDENRNKENFPPQLIDLAYVPKEPGKPGEPVVPPKPPAEIKSGNLNTMHQSVVNSTSKVAFFGGEYRKGEDTPEGPGKGEGSLEKGPHTAVHILGGSPNTTFHEDMGNFYSAGRDPLFYSHHANVDRCWAVWKSLGNSDIDEDDYRNTEFLFFDENQDLVRCKVEDCLDHKGSLKSDWANVSESDSKWINYKALPLAETRYASSAVGGSVVASLVPGMAQALATEYPELGPNSGTVTEIKGTPLTFSVAQPKEVGKGKTDEILTLQGLEVPMGTNTSFQVFINLPGATENTVIDCAEYVGSFYNIPHFMPGMDDGMTRTTNARFSIRENVQTLGLSNSGKITVTVVPRGKDKDVGFKFKGASIQYSS